MKQVTIYTDGACSGNPGPGGWGAILKYGAHEKELSGGEPSTTNNRMELLGAITALQSLHEPCQVSLYTDSQYLANAINLGWLRGWKQKGWRRKDGELKNADLWQTLDGLLQTHTVQFFWVKGHADNVYNNRCVALFPRTWSSIAAPEPIRSSRIPSSSSSLAARTISPVLSSTDHRILFNGEDVGKITALAPAC